jgi:very-short-patch-repair endonuclease
MGGCARTHTAREENHMSQHFHIRYAQRRQALLQQRARELRARETASERLLWQCLVNGKLGVAFRRQYVIGGRIADFAAPSVRLVVEVDGGWHAGRARADARRDRELMRLGWRVLRVPAEVVIRDLPLALASVVEAIAAHLPPT